MNTVQYTKILIGFISKKLGHTNLAKEAFLSKLIMTKQPLKINEMYNKPSSSFTVENLSDSPLSLPRKNHRRWYLIHLQEKKQFVLYEMRKNAIGDEK